MSVEVIIDIKHVTKEYRLGAIGGGTLKGDLQSLMARIRGKADPNAKIGQEVYAKNQRFLALNDVNFKVYKGERVGIIGHNGAGKSTLLKLLSRVTAPTKGKISYNGRIASMLEVGTGFHPELTGRENVYLNGAILGMTKAEIDAKFDDIVAFAEMEKFIDTPVKRYSSGMYVKLAFAVAAHLDSEIMVMDEVLAVGDMKFQQKCLGKMGEVSESEGRTVLYVSHNMNTIRQLCTRCIVLDHGTLVFDGDVEQAIGIYMNTASRDYNCKWYDFTKDTRLLDRVKKIEFCNLQVQNSDVDQMKRGEILSLLLNCIANEDVKHVKLRFEFFYEDGGVVGTAFSNKEINAMKGEKISLFLKVNTKLFPEGKYWAAMLAYESNEYGSQEYVDRVEPGFSFGIYETMPQLNWLHQYWGHIHLNDIEIDRNIVD